MPKVWTLGCTSECNFHSISLSPRPEPLPWPVTTPSTIIPCLARYYYTIIQLARRTQRGTNSRNRNSNFADGPKIQFNPTYTYHIYALWGSQCERNQAWNPFSEALRWELMICEHQPKDLKEDFSQLLQSGGGIPYLPYLYLSLPYLSEEVWKETIFTAWWHSGGCRARKPYLPEASVLLPPYLPRLRLYLSR